ncbi:PKD-like family lipoprotein [Chryseolinea soli]|nr:PKD-like family lipoprotein [Chryseolinea soli]
MKQKFNVKYFVHALLVMLLVQGCYDDIGNYDYSEMPGRIIIDASSIPKDYSAMLSDDTVRISPVISYAGAESDLRYSWQMWDKLSNTYVTFREGKNLEYKCGIDEFVGDVGSYVIRLSVANKKLPVSEQAPTGNEVYSGIVTLNVVSALFRGLVVLHGDGTQCDLGLIEDNIFLPKATDVVTKNVTPDFYSFYNQGSKIKGIGRQLVKDGYIDSWFGQIFGECNFYVFTDQGSTRANYLTLSKTSSDYSALFINPSDASGKPEFYSVYGTGSARALVDDGRVFYGYFVGPLYNEEFEYDAAPFALSIGNAGWSGGTSIGTIAFDKLSKGFMYSLYSQGATYLYKFPTSTVAGVGLEPGNTNADLIYMDVSARGQDTRAVMKDVLTGEKFLGVFNFWAGDRAQVTTGRYSMKDLPQIDDAQFYAIGGGVNLTYYATTKDLYQYLFQGSNTASSVFSAPNGEVITMVKIIKYESSGNSTSLYQYSNRMMIVATVNGANQGKVYAFIVNGVSGALTLASVYDGTESGGEHFGIIYDTEIKDQ